jgi:CyaY protein
MTEEEREFKKKADHALDLLKRALISASDDYGFGVDSHGGSLAVTFEYPPLKLAISPNVHARQIWISAHSRSYKLDWDIVENAFIFPDSGQTLTQLVEQILSKQLKSDVTL